MVLGHSAESRWVEGHTNIDLWFYTQNWDLGAL